MILVEPYKILILVVWFVFQVVMSSEVPVAELFMDDGAEAGDDRNARMLMDDLGIDRNSVSQS